MEGFISDIRGNMWRLPPLISWDMKYSAGEEADSFAVSFVAEGDFYDTVHGCCRFWAGHEGERVFTGVIDEYELTANGGGAVTTLYGRSLQALLMDNEALKASYRGVTLDAILDNHVRPLGITEIRRGDMAPANRLDVSAGESQWRVLREYCVFCGGVTPRFDRYGVLILDGSAGEEYVIDENSAVTAQTISDKRWGVISEAVVFKRGAAVSVENSDFKARGGSARRVITAPRYESYDAMRYTGAYQIERSAREACTCHLSLPAPCALFAGDRVRLKWSPLGVTGSFYVQRSLTLGSGGGALTEAELIREE